MVLRPRLQCDIRPIRHLTWWQDCMKALWDGRPTRQRQLGWWNMQCIPAAHQISIPSAVDRCADEVVGPPPEVARLSGAGPRPCALMEDDVRGDVQCPWAFIDRSRPAGTIQSREAVHVEVRTDARGQHKGLQGAMSRNQSQEVR